MYSTLQDGICTRMNFSGHHSIVAVSNVDNVQRVDMVRKDLRNTVRLPFEYVFYVSVAGLRAKVLQLQERCKTG